jgi:hypothetical protein
MNLRPLALAVSVFHLVLAGPAAAQDMLDMVDLKSDAFTKAEMTRADLEAALA